MKVPRILFLYVAREVVLYMAVGLVGVSLIFVGQNLLRYLGDFLRIGVAFSDVLMVLRAVVVVIMTYTIPIGFLFGVLAGVGRMAGDSEIMAFRTNGIGIRTVLVPVLVLSVLVSAVTAYLAIEVEHRTKRQLRDRLVSMTTSGRMIQPQRFMRIEDRMIYVESRDRDDRLEGVFISDRSVKHRPLLIFAEHGTFSYEPDLGQVQLRLENGAIHIEPENRATDVAPNGVNENEGRTKKLAPANAGAGQDGGYRKISFQTFDYAFEVDASMRAGLGRVRPKDMTMAELKSIIAKGRAGQRRSMLDRYGLREFEVQLQRRFALPMAPIVFALVAVPLSLRRLKGVSSGGVIVCGVLCLIYYCTVMFFQYLAIQGVLPVILAVWFPNVGLGAVGVALLLRARRIAI